MLKAMVIGCLGADSVMNYHGTDSVLNFSVAKTDKYKGADGNIVQKTTWISCSWWVDSQSKIAQYLKKGTFIYAEGIPEAKMWDGKDGKKQCGLGMRVIKVELLGGKKEDNKQPNSSSQQTTNTNGGYESYSDEVPF